MCDTTECTHQTFIPGRWVDNPYYDAEEDACGGYGGEMMEWEDEYAETLYVDIDIHRMRCARCGHIAYYSGAAHDFYENGNKDALL